MDTYKEGGIIVEYDDEVFLNPKMKINRDLSVRMVEILKPQKIVDGHSATGIRALRYARSGFRVSAVDWNPKAVEIIEKNARRNNLKIEIYREDVRSHLLNHRYDYVDLDPFGSALPYLPFAAETLAHQKVGYLALTATDTAVLCGAESEACKRLYLARPIHEDIVHEVGLRILIGRVQRTISYKNLGITPLLSLSHLHYMRVFLRVDRGAEATRWANSNIGYLHYCHSCGERFYSPYNSPQECWCGGRTVAYGPLWTGMMGDTDIMVKIGVHEGLMGRLIEENFDGYAFNIHTIAKKNHLRIPKTIDLIRCLSSRGIRSALTHQGSWIIRAACSVKEIIDCMKELSDTP